MAIELGQVAAIIYGTSAPANKKVIWGETDNNDPATQKVLNFYKWNEANNQWEIIFKDSLEWESIQW
ncbi:MAG: hypothetical protein LAT81_09855 [Oceanicaulis sp.]|nr:hypothetical protein [Oceanicaulis sp.]